MSRDGSTGVDRDDFRTIGEVAEALKVPQHVLRFWETRFPEVTPVKRAGGRRSYRPEDVVLLRSIRDLLYGEGYTIRGVQRLLRDQGAQAFRGEAVDPGPPPPVAPDPVGSRRIAPQRAACEVRLHAALADLVECRRILDRVRNPGG